jgi:hypothetical protein
VKEKGRTLRESREAHGKRIKPKNKQKQVGGNEERRKEGKMS